MIGSFDTLTGSPCFRCGEPIGSGYGLWEILPDLWEVVCADCDLELM